MSGYQEALTWMYGLESRGVKLGLAPMQAALSLRGNPHDGLRYLHVAGTNGKGSVCAMTERALRAAGYRTGWFSSPHLHRYVERIRINGRPIAEAEMARRLFSLRDDPRLPQLTFFEYTTVAAFEAFREHGCDVVVLEVGLGGRLDSTNVVSPTVTVVTNIGLDHMHVLGDNIRSIAREKAVKKWRRDWKIASGDEARRRCKMVSAKPTVPARLSFCSASARLNSSRTYSVTAL